ncbi:hypothetical protein CAEBREN_23087 [Caenorhabditis brenneri]|uniref:L-Fucosyltransferase n=1 Tax=Caenorhabditis brenneri TaxID=135651 RepID=G0MW37_CAEBE|nr:hypothetical protein CAEBREN_23087 [Caenorhabditis brenneri]
MKVSHQARLLVLVFLAVGFIYVCLYMENVKYRAPATPVQKSNEKYLSFQLDPISRLGNHLFELSSLLGIARSLKRIPIIYTENKHYEKMINDSRKAMPGLMGKFVIVNGTLPSAYQKVTFNPRCCVFVNPSVLAAIDYKFLHLTGQLCAHIRKGDFLSNDFAATDEKFLKNALKYVQGKEKMKKSNIVIFGDDLKFMRNLFNDTVLSNQNLTSTPSSIHFVSQNSPSEDLIYSKKHCDLVLISAPHSTFGWWMGYVSKGNKVYYMDIRLTKDRVYKKGNLHPADYYLPHWTSLRLTEDNRTIVES